MGELALCEWWQRVYIYLQDDFTNTHLHLFSSSQIVFLPTPSATHLIPPSQLQKPFGGEIDFQYDNTIYLPALAKLCRERKAERFQRWEKFGNGKCGLSETILSGAVVPEEVRDVVIVPEVVEEGVVVEKVAGVEEVAVVEKGKEEVVSS